MTNGFDKAAGLKIPSFDPSILASAAAKMAGLNAAGLEKLNTSRMASLASEMSAASERFKSAMSVGALDRLDTSRMAKLSKQIADQQKAIADLRPLASGSPTKNQDRIDMHLAHVSGLKLPPNPIFETNKRLKNIEARFDRMERIALDSAEIATGLQASAAAFLVKFENAAVSNDRTTKKAVWIGLAAIALAVLIPIAQGVYAEVYRAPADAAATQSAITDMKREITGLRQAQEQVADRISEAIAQNGKEQTTTLKEIKELLASQQQSLVAPAP